jgi:hypothetical protein
MGISIMLNFKDITATATPITAIGNVLDNLFTSKEEKLTKEEAIKRLSQKPQMAQTEINKIEAQHRSLFVAGWRPFIGWVCGFNLLYLVFLKDFISSLLIFFKIDFVMPQAIGVDLSSELVFALLGLGGLRTFEKLTGKTK